MPSRGVLFTLETVDSMLYRNGFEVSFRLGRPESPEVPSFLLERLESSGVTSEERVPGAVGPPSLRNLIEGIGSFAEVCPDLGEEGVSEGDHPPLVEESPSSSIDGNGI